MREQKSGQRLADRYTLVRRLGGGRAAETWLADDRLTGASVALKIARDSGPGADLLRREWQIGIRLVHAHIVRAFEFHSDSHGAFYSLQYIAGPDIGVLAGARLDEILPPVASVADALRYAHGKQIVHRDIKASNVLLDGNGAAYLIDFGVSAEGADDVGGGALIAASPQQLGGESPAPADDIFALGGLIYELASGVSPYSSADTAGDIRSAVPPPLVLSDGSASPAAVRQLLAEMLAKSPGDRPDAESVVARLVEAGYRPGPAPARFTGGASAPVEERIQSESTHRIRRRESVPARKTPAADRSGISPATVAMGLAALIVILLGVVFLLPRTLVQDPVEAAREAVPPVRTDESGARGAATAEPPERDERVLSRMRAEEVLGRLLSKTRTLEGRAVERWGGQAWKRAFELYEAGDAAYLERDYDRAADRYREAIAAVDPLLTQVDAVFRQTMADAERALLDAEAAEALRLYEQAVAISPGHAPARAGLARAQNLDSVLRLTEQGLALERELELDAARRSFAEAAEIDPQWSAATDGLERLNAAISERQFDARMTEGLAALAERDYRAARAAFRMADTIRPGATETADGLLQVELGLKLETIATLEDRAGSLEREERWQAAVETYEKILELDDTLDFAREGLLRSQRMAALHTELERYIADPDSLSSPRNMQLATTMVVDITRMPSIGPRLADQRDDLSRLLKRAATPLTVELVSDNATDVTIYKVGKLGAFTATEVTLRPGTYVAVGSRPGYRDVRLEFRVAPEIDMQPVVVRCEEKI